MMVAQQKSIDLQDDTLIRYILESANRAVGHLKNVSYEKFESDTKLQDAVTGCMLIIGNAADQVSDTVKNWVSEVPWHRFADMSDWLSYVDKDERRLRKMWRNAIENFPPIIESLQKFWNPVQ